MNNTTFKIIIDGKIIFTENDRKDLLEARGSRKMFEVATFGFSTTKQVATGFEKIEVWRNEKCLFKGKINRIEKIMDSSGEYRFDNYCTDILQELQNVRKFGGEGGGYHTINEWIGYLIASNSRFDTLKLAGSPNNGLRIEIVPQPDWTIMSYLNEIQKYDKGLSYDLNYETSTLTFHRKRGKAVSVRMWKQIDSIQETLDATEYKNTSSVISEWIEEVIHWKTVCQWIPGPIYKRGEFDDYRGDTMLMRSQGTAVPDLFPVTITTHVDTAQTIENYKDWVAIFGYDDGSGKIPNPYPNHRGLDFVPRNGGQVEILSPPFSTYVLDWSLTDNDDRGIFIELETGATSGPGSLGSPLKKYIRFRFLHFSYLDDRYIRVGGEIPLRFPMGIMGMTGEATGPHAHVDMRDGAGNWLDPYPYVFNVNDNLGWNKIFDNGYEECHEVIDWIEHVPHKLTSSVYEDIGVVKYGVIEFSERNNDLRTQEEVDEVATQNFTLFNNIGFARKVELSFLTNFEVELNDMIHIHDVPFIGYKEEAKVIEKNFDILEPNNESIALDSAGFEYIKRIIGGRKQLL